MFFDLMFKICDKGRVKMDNSVYISDGKIESYVDIKVKGIEWHFLSDDPQMCVIFSKCKKRIKVVLELGESTVHNHMSIYYRLENEKKGGYSEERKVEVDLKTNKKNSVQIISSLGIKEIRIDIAEKTGMTEIHELRIEDFEQIALLPDVAENFISETNKNKNKILVFTHELSATGAPILAYHIANSLRKRGNAVAIITRSLNNSFLKDNYKKQGLDIIALEPNQEDSINVFEILNNQLSYKWEYDKLIAQYLIELRDYGCDKIITNTIVTGKHVRAFKDYGFKIVSLIHEMKKTITMYGMYEYGINIAKYSDYVVFANNIVKNDFVELYKNVEGEMLVRPQGVYLEDHSATKEIKETGKKIIMSSGTGELRKGVDLFVSAALELLGNVTDRNNYLFVWTGDFSGDSKLKEWLGVQIERAGVQNNFSFLPFIKESDKYKEKLCEADVFWALSREDPFPSTVLEAMKYGVPVVGFRNTGGVEVMLQQERGILIDDFSVADVANATNDLLNGVVDKTILVENAKKYIEAELKFEDYTEWLETILMTGDEKVLPDLDLYCYWRNKHYKTQQKIQDQRRNTLGVIKKRFNKSDGVSNKEKVILLDTAIGSDNAGDSIIMNYCEKICKTVFDKEFLNIPTHVYDEKSENLESYLKILCGTNLIYTRMEDQKQWALPYNLSSYKNTCMLGVGMQQLGIEESMSLYTKQLLRLMFDNQFIHSVRDEQTKIRLNEIGIKNVVNTGCPTMWKLTPEHCKKIPRKKAPFVVTTVTDYMQAPEEDKYMLELLKQHYEKVYIWVQGQCDFEYLRSIIDTKEYCMIPPLLSELDNVLSQDNVEYIGTRLHAGIRSLNWGRRTLIVSIDNRAKSIAEDTALPIIFRHDLIDDLETYIYSERATSIKLPMEEIEKWKNQF